MEYINALIEHFNTVSEWLVFIYLHPLVTLIVIAVSVLGRQKFEAPVIATAKELWEQSAKAAPEAAGAIVESAKAAKAKANKIETYIFIVSCIIAVISQLAFYWPKSGQAKMICGLMSIAQVLVADKVYYYADKWGIMDRIFGRIAKKIDGQE